MNAHSNPISAQAPFIVPFSRDNSFVGREELLADIDVTKNGISLHRRAALVGLGGVGEVTSDFQGVLGKQASKKGVTNRRKWRPIRL
jgi:hypothetical protein